MKIITISREFGSGGRELGKRLADILGFDYYDREIISAIAEAKGMDEGYVENAIETHAWQSILLTYRSSFSANVIVKMPDIQLLLEQKKVIESIGNSGRDCVIVGRNADVILADYKPFNIFVCADMETKIQRCIDRAAEDEQLSRKDIEKKIRRIDKNRARTREMTTGKRWGVSESYHLTLNTTDWDIKLLAPAVADLAKRWFEKE